MAWTYDNKQGEGGAAIAGPGGGMTLAAVVAGAGWRAALELGFRRDGVRTVLARRSALGPLQVQRPFYPEGGVCHVYLLHPPGGIVGGDSLEITAEIEAGAQVLLTTPAAGKFYRSAGRRAEQAQRFAVADGAALEWFPQETIVFDGALARSTTRVELAPGARFIGWEIVCLGRPASGERFGNGQFLQGMEVYRQGRPLLLERNRFDGGGAVLDAPWGLGGYPVTATLVCAGGDDGDLAAVRNALGEDTADELTGATLIDDVLLVRFLGLQAERARERFIRAWEVLRPRKLGRAAQRPRIWNT
jgi:urease accessory protein